MGVDRDKNRSRDKDMVIDDGGTTSVPVPVIVPVTLTVTLIPTLTPTVAILPCAPASREGGGRLHLFTS